MNMKFNKCIECPKNYPYFDGNRCTVCPKDTLWNETSKECQTCKGGQKLINNVCQCPAGTFWDDNNCITCFVPKYFDKTKKQCVFCDNKMIYDPINNKCVDCPATRPLFDGKECTTCPPSKFFN